MNFSHRTEFLLQQLCFQLMSGQTQTTTLVCLISSPHLCLILCHCCLKSSETSTPYSQLENTHCSESKWDLLGAISCTQQERALGWLCPYLLKPRLSYWCQAREGKPTKTQNLTLSSRNLYKDNFFFRSPLFSLCVAGKQCRLPREWDEKPLGAVRFLSQPRRSCGDKCFLSLAGLCVLTSIAGKLIKTKQAVPKVFNQFQPHRCLWPLEVEGIGVGKIHVACSAACPGLWSLLFCCATSSF